MYERESGVPSAGARGAAHPVKYLLALAILAAIVSTVGGECYRREARDYEHRAVTAEAEAKRRTAIADLEAEDARAHEREAHRFRRQALLLADSLARLKPALDSQADAATVQAPEVCGAVVALMARYRHLYDGQLQVQAGLIESLRQDSVALEKRREEATQLRAANDTLLRALQSRPKPRKWWLPEPIGYAGYGVTASGGRVYTGWQVGVGGKIALPGLR